ncbi:hypothetical protein [Palleronia caenipelagi]|uniref:Uncharacterized protein n=1 Tax=Palleronia caenipelagi TaxID=2489174 RepID=A0A547Q742_9RHOB|nr:hypothetical protein [Palleronia caenipelagi]TRD22194.1 hypothetical protein FEV53_05585 [Palleronia caenipelagi]
MIKALRNTPDLIDEIIATHGTWHVLKRVIASALNLRRLPPEPDCEHLRRDVGLPPRADAPPDPWRYMR